MHRLLHEERPLPPHSARLRKSAGLPVGHANRERTWPREGIGAARCAEGWYRPAMRWTGVRRIGADHRPDRTRGTSPGLCSP